MSDLKVVEVELMEPVRPDVEAGPVQRVLTGLAHLPAGAILNEAALAGLLGVTDRTVRRMVQRGEVPPGIPFAGRTTWLAGKVLAHIESAADKAAKDAERRIEARKRLTG